MPSNTTEPPRLSPRRRNERGGLSARAAARCDRPDGRRLRAVQRLPRARVRVSVRRQRLVQHARAAQRRRIQRLRRLAPESRDRAGSVCCRSIRSSPTARSTACTRRWPGLQDLVRRRAARRSSPTSARCSRRRRNQQYQAKSVPLPPQLFSHNDQQDQWHALRGRNAHGHRLGRPHGRPDSRERREPAARDERLAGRQLAVSVRRRHGRVHDGRDGPARVHGLRRYGLRAASSAARSSASSTRATTRCMRAVSPRCSGAPSRPPTA